MPIADVMPLRLVSVHPDESVQVAIARMLEDNVGCVAVVDEGRLVGVFSERDVLRLAGEGTAFTDVRIGAVMTRDVVTVRPDDDVLEVANLMGSRRIRHVPVLQGEHVLGMVGIRDVTRVLLERAYDRHDHNARDTARELLGRPQARTS
jgi:CBS domain-containing protein